MPDSAAPSSRLATAASSGACSLSHDDGSNCPPPLLPPYPPHDVAAHAAYCLMAVRSPLSKTACVRDRLTARAPLPIISPSSFPSPSLTPPQPRSASAWDVG
ncbi:hypothetical protein K523DRAFT_358871 [Schizophyllum commune Tattone D]|nr:hypothetical protein K523DRAFT_358871 [Schizophyllum commune Tattone D]